MAVTTVERSSGSPYRSSPSARHAGAGGPGEQRVAGEDPLEALVEDQVERDVEPEDERHRRGERAVALALAGGGPRPVEVVAPAGSSGGELERARRHGGEREPGRAHQRLLGSGDDDVDPPRVLAQLGRAEPADRVDDEHGAAGAGDLGDRLDVVHDTGRGLAQRREDDLDARLGGQLGVDRGGIQALAPAGLVAMQLGPVGLAQLDPALAELARGARQHVAPRPREVGDRGLHRARAAGREGRARRWSPERRPAAWPAPARRPPRRPVRGGRASAWPSPGRRRAARAWARRSSGTA